MHPQRLARNLPPVKISARQLTSSLRGIARHSTEFLEPSAMTEICKVDRSATAQDMTQSAGSHLPCPGTAARRCQGVPRGGRDAAAPAFHHTLGFHHRVPRRPVWFETGVRHFGRLFFTAKFKSNRSASKTCLLMSHSSRHLQVLIGASSRECSSTFLKRIFNLRKHAAHSFVMGSAGPRGVPKRGLRSAQNRSILGH